MRAWNRTGGVAVLSLLLLTVVLGGCRGGEEGARPRGEGPLDASTEVGADVVPGDAAGSGADVTDETDAEGPVVPPELPCPGVAELPFEDRLQVAAGAWASDTNRREIERAKYDTNHNYDVAGNPGATQVVEGLLAVSTNPVIVKALPGETVSLWHWDRGSRDWEMLGRTVTDDKGGYRFDLGTRFGVGFHRTWAVFEAARRCYAHNIILWPRGTQVVITDIDGTMTRSDEENFREMSDPSYIQVQNEDADRLMQTWESKDYRVIYLTARPGSFRPLTQVWLQRFDFPPGLLITADGLVAGETARRYKREFVTRAKDVWGWEFVAAYGNADSDVQAYEDAGLRKDRTYIIGPEAGMSGTVPIANNDWSDHITNFVLRQPDATQPAELVSAPR